MQTYPNIQTSLVSISSFGIPIPAFSYNSCLNSAILNAADPTSKRMTCGLPSTSHLPQTTLYPFCLLRVTACPINIFMFLVLSSKLFIFDFLVSIFANLSIMNESRRYLMDDEEENLPLRPLLLPSFPHRVQYTHIDPPFHLPKRMFLILSLCICPQLK